MPLIIYEASTTEHAQCSRRWPACTNNADSTVIRIRLNDSRQTISMTGCMHTLRAATHTQY